MPTTPTADNIIPNIQKDIRLQKPEGKLDEVLIYVRTLPESIPIAIVELIARIAFVEGYAQLVHDRTRHDAKMAEVNSEGLEEIKEMCDLNTTTLKQKVTEALRVGEE